MDDARVWAASTRGTPEFRAVETLIKGGELPLPDGHFFHHQKRIPHGPARHLAYSPKPTYHGWKQEYGGAKVETVKRLKELERKNARLKKLVAEQALDMAILNEVAEGTERNEIAC